MPKLTDTQLVILAAAAKRDDRALLPLPKKLKLAETDQAKVLKELVKRRLAAEEIAGAGSPVWRQEDDQRFMLTLTPAGLRTIGAEPSGEADEGPRSPARRPRKPKRSARSVAPSRGKQSGSGGAGKGIRPGTKQGKLIELLRRPGGASLSEMQKATGWQAHSVRGVMSGTLKKKLGLVILAEKAESGERRYRIAE
jgi:hypothetical protein